MSAIITPPAVAAVRAFAADTDKRFDELARILGVLTSEDSPAWEMFAQIAGDLHAARPVVIAFLARFVAACELHQTGRPLAPSDEPQIH